MSSRVENYSLAAAYTYRISVRCSKRTVNIHGHSLFFYIV